jgi:hypothetical protein
VPEAFKENPDCYFRPWKVHADSAKTVKLKMKSDEWVAKADEHKDFLARVRQELKMKDDYGANLAKALWSITHVAGLIECETFWPTNERSALISRVNPADYALLTELACWVWQQRFLKSGFEHLLGGWIFLEMIMKTFNCNHANINLFSGLSHVCVALNSCVVILSSSYDVVTGHDYTILALLAIDPLICPELRRPIEFGSYIIFELWDNTPPPLNLTNGLQTHGGSGSGSGLTVDTMVNALYSSITVFADALQASICNSNDAKAAEQLGSGASVPNGDGRMDLPPTPTTATTPTGATPSPTNGQGINSFSTAASMALSAEDDHHPMDKDASTNSQPTQNHDSNSNNSNSGLSNRVLRIILNQRAFDRRNDMFGLDKPRPDGFRALVPSVRDDRAVVLADLNMQQVKGVVESVVRTLSALPCGLPAHFEMPQFE